MLAEAARRAGEMGIGNARWVQAVAEDLPAAAPGPFRLATFGQSFHRTRERDVAEAVYDLLEPGGAMAMVVPSVEGRPVPPNPGHPPIPHEEIRALVRQYLGSNERMGQGYVPSRHHRFEDVLAQTRFGHPETLYFSGIPDLLRDPDTVLSGYLSLSTSAPHLFGDRLDDFCRDVRALLERSSPAGLFWEWPGDTAVILARRSGL